MKLAQQLQNIKSTGQAGSYLGIGLMIVAALMLVFAGIMVAAPDQGKATLHEVGKTSALSVCQARVESMGFVFQPQDESGARVSMLGSKEGHQMETLMARADSVVQSCPGMRVTELCAGDDCAGSRLTVSLDYQGATK